MTMSTTKITYCKLVSCDILEVSGGVNYYKAVFNGGQHKVSTDLSKYIGCFAGVDSHGNWWIKGDTQ